MADAYRLGFLQSRINRESSRVSKRSTHLLSEPYSEGTAASASSGALSSATTGDAEFDIVPAPRSFSCYMPKGVGYKLAWCSCWNLNTRTAVARMQW